MSLRHHFKRISKFKTISATLVGFLILSLTPITASAFGIIGIVGSTVPGNLITVKDVGIAQPYNNGSAIVSFSPKSIDASAGTFIVTSSPGGFTQTVTNASSRTNLETNPSFEGNITGWTNLGATTYSTGAAKVGTGSALIAYNGSTLAGMSGSLISVTPGQSLTYSFYAQRSADIGQLTYNLMFYAADGTTIIADNTHANIPVSQSTSGFFRASQSVTVPFGAYKVMPKIYVSPTEGGGATAFNTYVDAVLVETDSRLMDYFDGTNSILTSGRYSGVTQAWTGTANASTSTFNATDTTGPYAVRMSGLSSGVSYTFTITPLVGPPAVISGGTLSSDATYYYMTFLSSGTITLTGVSSIAVDALVIAGGGLGGNGGAGAGGVLYTAGTMLNSGSTAVTVGAAAQNSSFNSLVAIAGGGEGSLGGSGGGGGYYSPWTVGAGTAGQGYGGGGGGTQIGAGGGAGGIGGSGTGSLGGIGTNAYASWATATGTGVNGYYASGGDAWPDSAGNYAVGGGGANQGANAVGKPNTGGGNGGTGIVIIRYLKSSVAAPGNPTNPSPSVVVTTLPQAPTIGTATAGNASASVTYTNNLSGGTPATTTIVSSPGSITGTGSSSPITVNGLTNGTAYMFTATAVNANGSSAASGLSNCVTPNTTPSQVCSTGTISGGTLTSDATYYYQTFLTSGTLTVTGTITIDSLIIAGGGGAYNGGGGGGGVLYTANAPITAGSYPIAIGAGGASATKGQNSTFNSLIAIGGGLGGSSSGTGGGAGGSGGGAAGLGTSGQGYNGGSVSYGGGGGAGGPGNDTSNGGGHSDGGPGTCAYSTWATATGTGVSGCYAGGGGGYPYGIGGIGGGGTSSNSAGTVPLANTGGGAGLNLNPGGSGIVIIRYTRSQVGG